MTVPPTTPAPDIKQCVDRWDGAIESVVKLAKGVLVSPDSFESVETLIRKQPNVDGTYYVRMEFSSENALGARLRSFAGAHVDPATCGATLIGVVPA